MYKFYKHQWTAPEIVLATLLSPFILLALLALVAVSVALWPITLIVIAVWLISRRDKVIPTGFDSDSVNRSGVIVATPTQTIPIPQLNYFKVSEKAVNKYWSEAFYDNLKFFTGSNPTSTYGSFGLIYYFVVNGQIRYIGQTKERGLRWRMTKRQSGGVIGYNYYIKRNLLQAASRDNLVITTKRLPVFRLNQVERSEIRQYGPTNKLWNQEHNTPHFHIRNFYQ